MFSLLTFGLDLTIASISSLDIEKTRWLDSLRSLTSKMAAHSPSHRWGKKRPRECRMDAKRNWKQHIFFVCVKVHHFSLLTIASWRHGCRTIPGQFGLLIECQYHKFIVGGNEIQNISGVTCIVSQGPVNGRKLSDQRTCKR